MKPVIRHRIKNDVAGRLLRGDTYSTIAHEMTDKYGVAVTRSTVAGIARDIKANRLDLGASREAPKLARPQTYIYGVEETNGLPVFTGHPVIDEDKVAVIADLHLPYTNYKFVEKIPKIMKKHGVKTLLIAGDFIDGDSRHHKHRVRRANLSEQLKYARNTLSFLLEEADHIYLLPGNHDEWFVYDTDGELSVEDTMRLMVPDGKAGRVTAIPYDRVQVVSSGEVWTVPHQAGASVDPLRIGRELALKFQTNVITPHQHLSASGWDKYNRYFVISVGGLHDAEMFDYIQLKTTTMYNPNLGMAVLDRGRGILITPDSRQTDWRKYGGW